MFIIYQIHEMSGEYEDYRDTIVGSYLRKDRAEEVIKTLRDKEDRRRACAIKCRECPVQDYNRYYDRNFRSVINKYCEDFEEEHELDYGEEQLFCKNEYYSYSAYDDAYYEIQEVEVEE